MILRANKLYPFYLSIMRNLRDQKTKVNNNISFKSSTLFVINAWPTPNEKRSLTKSTGGEV